MSNVRFQDVQLRPVGSGTNNGVVRRQVNDQRNNPYESKSNDSIINETKQNSSSTKAMSERHKSLKRGYENELNKSTEDALHLTELAIPISPRKEQRQFPPPAIGHVKKQTSNQDNTKLFIGKNPLQFALWAHYMSYGAALFCVTLGVFAIFWTYGSNFYNCKINGQPIALKYFNPNGGLCTNSVILTHNNPNKIAKLICCDPKKQNPSPSITGNIILGCIYIGYSVILILVENTSFGWGNYYRNDNLFYQYRISPFGLLNIGLGIYGTLLPVTMLAGFCLITLGTLVGYSYD